MRVLLPHITGLFLITVLSVAAKVKTVESSPIFHDLLLTKTNLEKQFGIKTLECFPFIENIGFTEDQKPLIHKCLKSVKTLKQALTDNPISDLHTVGISNRFMWVGGFHDLLVPWNVGKEEIIKFFNKRLSKEEQKGFLDKILTIKQKIRSRIKIGDLYCTKRISNAQCLVGYKNLLSTVKNLTFKNKHWPEIAITNSFDALNDPRVLTLKFNASTTELMDSLVFRDIQKIWKSRKETYDAIEERHGEALHRRLQLGNFICAVNLTSEECLKAANSLDKASLDLQGHPWGIVKIDKYNTFISDDYDATIRYDLNYLYIVRYFSVKPTTKETQKNNTLAKNLEERTKNNSTKLRVVCDLEGLHSALCVKGFQMFFEFLKRNPDYNAIPPLETLMMVDGDQLARVNFTLNSGTRKNYIYVDVNSTFDEFKTHLMVFRKTPETKKTP